MTLKKSYQNIFMHPKGLARLHQKGPKIDFASLSLRSRIMNLDL